MPTWLLSLLINLAFKVGVPLILKWFPGIPTWVIDILNKLKTDIGDNPPAAHPEIKKAAHLACKDALNCNKR